MKSTIKCRTTGQDLPIITPYRMSIYDVGAQPVSNREYEDRIQDEKRQIKLLDPAYLQIFVEEFEKLMSE